MKNSTAVLVEKKPKLLNTSRLSKIDLAKKALFSAFFCALTIYATPSAIGAPTNTCGTQQFDETATLKYVHDGDTIRLSDNRKIRLLGIDTPELARKGNPTQPYALDAKKALKILLSSNKGSVNLVYGNERKDHYGRTLAHLFLDNGVNVQSALISQGLAIAFTTPPNTKLSDCYSTTETTARLENQGIWAHQKYKPIQADKVTINTTGFRIIEGNVHNIKINPKSVWINLENDINIKIREKDRQYFNTETLNCLMDKSIQIRGWLHPNKKGSYMSLRHPSAIKVINNKPCN